MDSIKVITFLCCYVMAVVTITGTLASGSLLYFERANSCLDWSLWDSCTVECGRGTRSRLCLDDNYTELGICNNQTCTASTSGLNCTYLKIHHMESNCIPFDSFSSTASDCRARCNHNAMCYSFLFDKMSTKCRLYQCVSTRNISSCHSCSLSIRQCSISCPYELRAIDEIGKCNPLYPGYKFDDITDCFVLCNAEPRCQLITIQDVITCTKYNCQKPSYESCAECSSYLKSSCDVTYRYLPKGAGTIGSCNRVFVDATTNEACATACNRDSTCLGYMFDYYRWRCYIQGCTGYITQNVRTFELYTNTADVSQMGQYFNCSAIDFTTGSDIDCKNKCQQHTTCTSVTYDNTTLACMVHSCRDTANVEATVQFYVKEISSKVEENCTYVYNGIINPTVGDSSCGYIDLPITLASVSKCQDECDKDIHCQAIGAKVSRYCYMHACTESIYKPGMNCSIYRKNCQTSVSLSTGYESTTISAGDIYRTNDATNNTYSHDVLLSTGSASIDNITGTRDHTGTSYLDLGICRCTCRFTNESVDDILAQRIQYLMMKKNLTSSRMNTLKCADDERESSKGIGSGAMFILASVPILIVTIDLLNILLKNK